MGDRFGSYLGLVQDNRDPEQRGRVKLLVPTINARQILPFWALPAGQCVGGQVVPGGRSRRAARGCFVVPDMGAQVIVQFLDGNPEMPIWWPGPPVVADVPPGVKSSASATVDRYPAVAQLLRGRSVEVIEHEKGDLDVAMDGAREIRIDTRGAKLTVRTLPDNPVVINDGDSTQKAARVGDRVSLGTITLVYNPGTGAVTGLTLTRPGGAPITLTALSPSASLDLAGEIAEGSERMLVGGDPTS